MSEGFFKAASGENLWMYLIVLAFWGISALLESKKKARIKREREAQRNTSSPSHREPVVIEETFESSMDHEEVPSEHIQTEVFTPVDRSRVVRKEPVLVLEKVSNYNKSTLPLSLFPRGIEQAFIVSEILGKPKSQRRGRQ